MPKKKIPWEQMRLEYATTSKTLREIAREYKYSPNTVLSRARRNGWAKDRETVDGVRTEVLKKAVEEQIAPIMDKVAEMVTEISTLSVEKCLKALIAVDYTDTKKLKDVTAALRDLKELGFISSANEDSAKITIAFEGGEGDEELCK